jgi:hypothetical protein
MPGGKARAYGASYDSSAADCKQPPPGAQTMRSTTMTDTGEHGKGEWRVDNMVVGGIIDGDNQPVAWVYQPDVTRLIAQAPRLAELLDELAAAMVYKYEPQSMYTALCKVEDIVTRAAALKAEREKG